MKPLFRANCRAFCNNNCGDAIRLPAENSELCQLDRADSVSSGISKSVKQAAEHIGVATDGVSDGSSRIVCETISFGGVEIVGRRAGDVGNAFCKQV